MTVAATTRKAGPFNGDGVTVIFNFAFKIFATADVVVTKTDAAGIESTLVINTDYSVAMNVDQDASPGGVVTTTVAPAAGEHLTLSSAVAESQGTHLPTGSGWQATVVERALDKLTVLVQQILEKAGRQLRGPVSDSATLNDLPTAVNRASKFLGFDSNGQPVALVGTTTGANATTFGKNLVESADASAGLTVLGFSAYVKTLVAAATKAALTALFTPLTTKGDLWVFAAADARKAAGTNGKVLVADSSQADGLQWGSKKHHACGRLTLTTGVPVTSADVSAAATVYFSPYNGDTVELYDGAGWIPSQFAELSQALNDATKSPAAAILNTNYDMFVWNDAGTLRSTRGPTWNAGAVAGSDTARGTGAASTELELFEGRYVNKNAITNGPAARRGLYVGTIRTTGAVQAEDSKAKRFVWNNFNRAERPCAAPLETADSWNYQSATIRQANANAANKFEVVRGLNEDVLKATVIVNAVSSGANAAARVGVGVDTTTAFSGYTGTADASSALGLQAVAFYEDVPGLGYHYASWNESSQATTAVTFQGDGGAPATMQSGIFGRQLG